MEIEELYKKFKECQGVSTDTRKLTENSMFFALKGDNFNGNRFIETAFSSGAKYCVIDEKSALINSNCILVADVLSTLQQLATYHRKSLTTKIIGLTGSNGKTTTKELINAVLSTTYKVKATVGNLNNHIGVPLTLLSFKEDLDFGIVEMGANHQKEIEFLSSLAQPDFVFITNFGKAHLEGFGGVQGIIKGKSELYDYAKSHNKTIFVNTDDKKQVQQTGKYANVITFGSLPDNDYQINFKDVVPFVSLEFSNEVCLTQLIGAYNFNNIAIAVALGQFFKVPNDLIKKAIEHYVPKNNRSQIITKGTNSIILDAYNANPTSMSAALENFRGIEAEDKYLFLGDMLELGEAAQQEHQTITDIASSNFEKNIYLIGENFFKAKTSDKIKKFKTYDDFEKHIKSTVIQDASILVKGSRGMALERILDVL
jgi:UDP-N-acetylmuramoyl-tripeptide--D-alanyl-D-alanine ligase